MELPALNVAARRTIFIVADFSGLYNLDCRHIAFVSYCASPVQSPATYSLCNPCQPGCFHQCIAGPERRSDGRLVANQFFHIRSAPVLAGIYFARVITPSPLLLTVIAPLWLLALYSHILVALYHINIGALALTAILATMLRNKKHLKQ